MKKPPNKLTDISTTDSTIIAKVPTDQLRHANKHPYILFQQGPLFGKMVLLTPGSVVIGRSPDADITVNDDGISRKHLKLTYQDGETIATDLKSTNGTFVNGDRITTYVLEHEDKLQISSQTLIKYIYADKLDESTQQELYNMGHLDPLTNVYNKRHLVDRLQGEFSFAFRRNIPLSVLMIDLDYFKKINDTYGHPAGDYVLINLVKLANSIIREEDILARFGGEEFVLILKDTAHEGARILAERLRELIEEHTFEFDDQTMPVTVSIGVATLNKRNYSSEDDFLKEADRNLYKSKQAGRNRVTCDV